MDTKPKIYGNLSVGDPIHLDPRRLPELVVISKEEADRIADEAPKRVFVVSWGKSK